MRISHFIIVLCVVSMAGAQVSRKHSSRKWSFASEMVGPTYPAALLEPQLNVGHPTLITTDYVFRKIKDVQQPIVAVLGGCLSSVPAVFKNGVWWAWASRCDGNPYCYAGGPDTLLMTWDQGLKLASQLSPTHMRSNVDDTVWTWVSSNGWRYATLQEWSNRPWVLSNCWSQFGACMNAIEPAWRGTPWANYTVPSVEVCACSYFDPFYWTCEYFDVAQGNHVSRLKTTDTTRSDSTNYSNELWFVHDPCNSLDSIEMKIEPAWNLISLSRVPSADSTLTIFPEACSDAYSYEGGYKPNRTLQPAIAYWIKFSSAMSKVIQGYDFLGARVPLVQGWNLIGSISVDILVSDITSNDSSVVLSDFYSYDGGYSKSDTIKSGKGYWVMASENCSIFLTSETSRSGSWVYPVRIVPTVEMPPPPPTVAGVRQRAQETAKLFSSYPNPFNPSTTIEYQIVEASDVKLIVYNVLGKSLDILVDKIQTAGSWSAKWDGSNFPSGAYFYRLTATPREHPNRAYSQSGKMLLLR